MDQTPTQAPVFADPAKRLLREAEGIDVNLVKIDEEITQLTIRKAEMILIKHALENEASRLSAQADLPFPTVVG